MLRLFCRRRGRAICADAEALTPVLMPPLRRALFSYFAALLFCCRLRGYYAYSALRCRYVTPCCADGYAPMPCA